MDSRQAFVIGAFWDNDELIRFWGSKGSKVKDTLSQQRHPELDAAIEFRFLVFLIIAPFNEE